MKHLLFILCLHLGLTQVQSTTYTVYNFSDLVSAINNVNSSGSGITSQINFATQVVEVTANLPAINNSVEINGLMGNGIKSIIKANGYDLFLLSGQNSSYSKISNLIFIQGKTYISLVNESSNNVIENNSFYHAKGAETGTNTAQISNFHYSPFITISTSQNLVKGNTIGRPSEDLPSLNIPGFPTNNNYSFTDVFRVFLIGVSTCPFGGSCFAPINPSFNVIDDNVFLVSTMTSNTRCVIRNWAQGTTIRHNDFLVPYTNTSAGASIIDNSPTSNALLLTPEQGNFAKPRPVIKDLSLRPRPSDPCKYDYILSGTAQPFDDIDIFYPELYLGSTTADVSGNWEILLNPLYDPLIPEQNVQLLIQNGMFMASATNTVVEYDEYDDDDNIRLQSTVKNVFIGCVGNTSFSTPYTTKLGVMDIASDFTTSTLSCIRGITPQRTKKYLIGAWVKYTPPSSTPILSYHRKAYIKVSFAGSNQAAALFTPNGNIIDGWQRIEGVFTVPADATDVLFDLVNNADTDEVYFDDIRLHPFDANMKTFVYDERKLRLVSEMDENNYATIYEYDNSGRLIRVKKETEQGTYTIKETKNGDVKNTQ